MSQSTGQKFGRNKRAPSNKLQASRTAANRERRIEKAEAVRRFHKVHPRITARMRRRAEKFGYSLAA